MAMGTNLIPTGTDLKVVMLPVPPANVDTMNEATFMQTYTGNTFIAWATDVGDCGVSQIKLCDDASCNTLTTSNVSLAPANPHLMDTYGNVNPIIKLDMRQPLAQEVYIVGYSSDASVSASVKTTFIICGDEQLTQNSTHPVYNILQTQENVNTTEWLELDIS